MSKLLATLVAAMFALGSVSAFADEKALAAACKDKKAGDEVTVDGKKVKCPAPAATKK